LISYGAEHCSHPFDLDERSSDPAGRSFAKHNSLYIRRTWTKCQPTAASRHSTLGRTLGQLRAHASTIDLSGAEIAAWLERNSFIESTIYFFDSTVDAEGRFTRFTRQT
jgi:hypothetical protein